MKTEAYHCTVSVLREVRNFFNTDLKDWRLSNEGKASAATKFQNLEGMVTKKMGEQGSYVFIETQ